MIGGALEGARWPGTLRAGMPLVALVAAIFLLNVAARSTLGPLLPAIEADLAIGHAQAGALFLLTTVGYAAGLVCSSPLSVRLSPRATIVLSAAVMGVTLLALAATGTLSVLRPAAIALGFAGGVYLPAGIGTVTTAVAPPVWGKALALHELAPNLAFTLTPLVVEGLLARLSWRGVLAAFGLASLASALAGPVLPRTDRSAGRAAAPPWHPTLAFFSLATLLALAVGLNLGVLTMLPLYLTAGLGVERTAANHWVAYSRVVPCITLFAAGWVADRVGPRRALTVALSASAVATAALGLVPARAVLAVVVLQPIVTVGMFPALFATLVSLGPRAFAAASPVAMIVGGGVVPAALGALAEWGRFRESFVVLGALSLLGALAFPLLEAASARGEPRGRSATAGTVDSGAQGTTLTGGHRDGTR